MRAAAGPGRALLLPPRSITLGAAAGLVEIKFHNLLVRYVALTKARKPQRRSVVQVLDPGAAASGYPPAGGADAASGGTADAPIVADAAAAVGPVVPSGDLRRIMTVVAPSIGDTPALPDSALRPNSSSTGRAAVAAGGGATSPPRGGVVGPSGAPGSRLAPLMTRQPSPLTHPDESEPIIETPVLRSAMSSKRLVPIALSEAPAVAEGASTS